MKEVITKIIIFCILSICSPQIQSQKLRGNGALLLKADITLGNQNQWIKLGIYGFGAISFGDIAVESGVSIASYQFFKRHTIKTSGIALGYEFFALGGIGKNTNLLGSSISEMNTNILYDPTGQGGFNGLGFGFSKDKLPGKLGSYGLKRGMFLMRFSNANHNIHLSFLNDFNIGWFNGSGTDYGVTGSLHLGFTNAMDIETIYQIGLGLDLFTPRPDYGRLPRNPINSDDGRKTVWYTLPPYTNLFYGNIFAMGTVQKSYFSVHSKLGMNSQKLGAYVQNLLHDGAGLNPRFPWDTSKKDKAYIELSGSVLDELE